MVRTKASAGAGMRATAEKAPRKNFGGTSSRIDLGSPSAKKEKYAGGNTVCPRPTPDWQKPIDKFFSLSTDPKNAKKTDKFDSSEKENTAPALNDESSHSKKALRTKDSSPGSSTSLSVSNGAIVKVDDAISED